MKITKDNKFQVTLNTPAGHARTGVPSNAIYIYYRTKQMVKQGAWYRSLLYTEHALQIYARVETMTEQEFNRAIIGSYLHDEDIEAMEAQHGNQ